MNTWSKIRIEIPVSRWDPRGQKFNKRHLRSHVVSDPTDTWSSSSIPAQDGSCIESWHEMMPNLSSRDTRWSQFRQQRTHWAVLKKDFINLWKMTKRLADISRIHHLWYYDKSVTRVRIKGLQNLKTRSVYEWMSLADVTVSRWIIIRTMWM